MPTAELTCYVRTLTKANFQWFKSAHKCVKKTYFTRFSQQHCPFNRTRTKDFQRDNRKNRTYLAELSKESRANRLLPDNIPVSVRFQGSSKINTFWYVWKRQQLLPFFTKNKSFYCSGQKVKALVASLCTFKLLIYFIKSHVQHNSIEGEGGGRYATIWDQALNSDKIWATALKCHIADTFMENSLLTRLDDNLFQEREGG